MKPNLKYPAAIGPPHYTCLHEASRNVVIHTGADPLTSPCPFPFSNFFSKARSFSFEDGIVGAGDRLEHKP